MVDRVGAGALLASLMLGHLGTFHLLGYAVGPLGIIRIYFLENACEY